MTRFLLLVLVVISTAVQANPNQTLSNGNLAYYGQDFSPNMGGDLKLALSKILSARHCSSPGKFDTIGSCGRGTTTYQHTAVGYSRARVVMFGELDMKKDSRGTFVKEVYCRENVYFKDPQSISGMSNVVNIEHTWPQSKFNSQFNTELQKSDMHHLYPSNSKANSVRANHIFGEANGDANGQLCDASHIDGNQGRFVFMPPSEHRGNVARALFYFSTRYNLPITQGEERVLRDWHEADPVDGTEVERNNLIAKHQFDRNPYVDFPELVERIQDF
jgi:deoxyribonuclease-1